MERSAAQAAVFERVEAPSTFEETVERLGTAIRLGVLAPGSRLPPERELAEELGISRSTLRQALTTLMQSGHLVSVRGRTGGTFVAESPPLVGGAPKLEPEGARAVLDHRVAVECGAVVLACERAEPEDLKRMEALVDEMGEADPFDDYRRADMRFHIALAEAARSPRLVAEMTEAQGAMSELIALIPHPAEVLRQSNHQHRRLVQRIGKGDVAAAVPLIRAHIAGTEHILAGLGQPAG
jgi:GntR family transcriptional repressor for pyruvate dehydrogenase complex